MSTQTLWAPMAARGATGAPKIAVPTIPMPMSATSSFLATEWTARAFGARDELALPELGAKLYGLVVEGLGSRPQARAVINGSSPHNVASALARECFRRSGRGPRETISRHAVELWLKYWVVGAEPRTSSSSPRRAAATAVQSYESPPPAQLSPFRARGDVEAAALALKRQEAEVGKAKRELCERVFRAYARRARPASDAKALEGEREWQAASAPDGRRYYYNARTRESRWTLPPSAARRVARSGEAGRRIEAVRLGAALEKLRFPESVSNRAVAAVRGGARAGGAPTASREDFSKMVLSRVCKAGRGGEEALVAALELSGGSTMAALVGAPITLRNAMSEHGEEPFVGSELDAFMAEAEAFAQTGDGGAIDLAAFARHLHQSAISAGAEYSL